MACKHIFVARVLHFSAVILTAAGTFFKDFASQQLQLLD